MDDSRGKVLIGDANRGRASVLEEILEKDFQVEVSCVETYEEVEKQTSHSEWTALFIGDELPFTKNDKKKFPIKRFESLLGQYAGINLFRLVDRENTPPLKGVFKPLHLFVTSSLPSPKEHDRIISRIEQLTGLARRTSLPEIDFDDEDDSLLQAQLRSLGKNRRLEEGKMILRRLIADCLDCNKVTVTRLSQGRSGASVFRVRPENPNPPVEEFVLKLTDNRQLEKIKQEIRGHLEAEEILRPVKEYNRHIPILKPPRKSDEALKYVVNNEHWYAIHYDFLGGVRFGKFLDLETALTAGADELRNKTSGTPLALTTDDPARVRQWRREILNVILDWLCDHLYGGANRGPRDKIKRHSRKLWQFDDAADLKYQPHPPYYLSGNTKEEILRFLHSREAELGSRILPDWGSHPMTVRRFIEGHDRSRPRLFDQTPSVIISPVHGDLNANNVMLWLEERAPFLIDFPFFQKEGHALQDLAHLEVEIKFALMDRQADSPREFLKAYDHTHSQLLLWTRLEDHLRNAYWRDGDVDWPAQTFQENAKMCLELVQLVRSYAVSVQQQKSGGTTNDDFFAEYLPALFFYTIRAVSYESLSVFKRLLAVYSAGKLLASLDAP